MAALRGKVVTERLTRCMSQLTNLPSVSTLPIVVTRNKQWFIPRSHHHTGRGSRGPLVRTLLGYHNHGRFLLVSAVAVRHNSSQSIDPVLVTSPITEQLSEAPPTVLDVLQGAGVESSLSELGLCSYTPVGLIQSLLEFMHVSVGLPWWGGIVAVTIAARCAVFPLIVKGHREAVKLNNVLPELTKLSNHVEETKHSGDKFEHSQAYAALMLFQRKHDVNPVRPFLMPLIHAPIFLSFFIALRRMAELPVPSLQTGGLWWFTDLTAADPFYILPVAVTGTMFAILKLSAESRVNDPNMKTMEKIFSLMPILILLATINFPTAVFTYWLTSNIFSIGQAALLRHPAVRQKLRIPKQIIHPASEESVKKGPLQQSPTSTGKSTIPNSRQEKALERDD